MYVTTNGIEDTDLNETRRSICDNLKGVKGRRKRCGNIIN